MRKFVITALVAAGATVAAAAPAQAQFTGYNQAQRGQAHHQLRYNARAISNEINQLSNQINRAQQRRQISAREATGLRRQVVQLQRQYNQFARNGLDQREVRTLQNGVNQVRRNLRLEIRDFDRFRG